MLSTLSVLLLVSIVSAVPNIISVPNGHCQNNSDCASNECCLLGPTRYATPHCMPLQQIDEQCRTDADTITTNLTYPDNSQLEVNGINYILCPCVEGSFCNPKIGICQNL